MEGMLLPKGIVVNSSWIYDEVAAYPVVPPEKIKKYWQVYTTTFRKLVDPTANRLENFWWHVWGSDRRELPGPVLARLFQQISQEPTFVKLRGPPNRYEAPSPPPSPERPQARQSSSAQVTATESTIGHAEHHQLKESKGKDKAVSPSSSSRHAPAKPILKKARGPSSSGPRPTARFASPTGSADLETHEARRSEDAASESTAVSSEEEEEELPTQRKTKTQPRKTDKRKQGPSVAKKKGAPVPTVSAPKRRPAMPRRQSSQPSAAASDNAPVGGTSASKETGSQRAATKLKPADITSKSVLEASETVHHHPAQSSGKQPLNSSSSKHRDGTDKGIATNSNTSDAAFREGEGYVDGSSPETMPSISGRDATVSPASSAPSKSPAIVPGRRSASLGLQSAPGMARSQSDTEPSRLGSRDLAFNRRAANPRSLISSSTTITSDATAQGTIIEYDENTAANEVVTNTLREQEEDGPEPLARRSTASSVDSRFAPTQPSTAPTVPLGRSKSQLTLLLERQGDRRPRQ